MTRLETIPPSGLAPGARVWAYLRDSGGDAQEQSVPQQRAEVEAFCERHKLILVHVFSDVAKSGGSVAGRQAFEDMLEMSKDLNLRPAGLLVWNFARFARDLDDSSFYKATLRKRGIVIHSLTDPIPEGDYSRLVESLIDFANEEKRRQTSRDSKRALQSLVSQGYACGGFPPKGYIAVREPIGVKRDGTPRTGVKWVPDPVVWEDVKLAWQMRAAGAGYAAIREATGRRLFSSKSSFVSFFLNRSYLGIGKCGEHEYPDHHAAAVDLEGWEKVRQLDRERLKPDNPRHPRRVSSTALLSGLAFCLYCGAAMHKDYAGKNDWPCYVCGHKVRHGYKSCEGRLVNLREADKAVLDAVLVKILTPDFVGELLEETRRIMTDSSGLRQEEDRLRGELQGVQKMIQSLLDHLETGSKAVIERLMQREGEKAKFESDLRQLAARRQVSQAVISSEALELVIEHWRGEVESAREVGNTQAMRQALSRFVSKVELGYNKARIWYTYPVNALVTLPFDWSSLGAHKNPPGMADFCVITESAWPVIIDENIEGGG